MQTIQLKSGAVIAFAALSAIALTFSVITPAMAEIKQGIDTKADCAAFRYPADGQELNINTVEDTGLVHVGYNDESGKAVQRVFNYKSNDGFAGCSDDAKDLLTRAKGHADKTRLDTCTEFKGLLDGSIALPEDPDLKFNPDGARQYIAELCQDQQ